MTTISAITANAIIDVVPEWGADNFDEAVDTNFKKLALFAPQLNQTITNINTVASEMKDLHTAFINGAAGGSYSQEYLNEKFEDIETTLTETLPKKLDKTVNNSNTDLGIKNLYLNNGAIISNDSDGFNSNKESSNIDHFYHSDTTFNGFKGVWNFCSDAEYKSLGNSAVVAGGFFSGGNQNYHKGLISTLMSDLTNAGAKLTDTDTKVSLSSSVTSSSTTWGATSKGLKTAYDKAIAANTLATTANNREFCLAIEVGLERSARDYGDIVSGSLLRPAKIGFQNSPDNDDTAIQSGVAQAIGGNDNGTLSGTWKLLGGYANNTTYNDHPISLWEKVAD